MKIYDCFIFNSELDLLKLRLAYLYAEVDYFVLVESPRTLANKKKPLYYQQNKNLFSSFQSKIIHLIVEDNDLPAWEYEFFQRDSIRNALKNCAPDDLIFVSDVDEIVNIKAVQSKNILTPSLIELSMYYYYINYRVGTTWIYNLVSPYHHIVDFHIGNRNTYRSIAKRILANTDNNLGWHFSYLFGNNIQAYKDKIRSFSHQEFNTPYYLNDHRLRTCIHFGIDIFERPYKFTVDESPGNALCVHLTTTQLSEWIHVPEGKHMFKLQSVYWLFRMKILNRVRNGLRNRLFKRTSI